MVGSSPGGGEQMAPSSGSRSPLSNTMKLDRAPRNSHMPTHVLEKAPSPDVSLCGALTVISFCRDLHSVTITEITFFFLFLAGGDGSLVLNSYEAAQSLDFFESSEFIADRVSTVHGWRWGNCWLRNRAYYLTQSSQNAFQTGWEIMFLVITVFLIEGSLSQWNTS